MPLKHTFVSAITDDASPAGKVQPSHWNAGHDLSAVVPADLPMFVPSTAFGLQAYVTGSGGAQTTVRYEASKGTSSLVLRGTDGRADIQTALVDNPDGIANVAFVQAAQTVPQKTPLGDSGETTRYIQSFVDGYASVTTSAVFGIHSYRAVKVSFEARTRLIPMMRVSSAPVAPGVTMYASLYAAGGTGMRPLDRVVDLGSFSVDTIGTVASSSGAIYVDAGEYYLVWMVNDPVSFTGSGQLLAVTQGEAGLVKPLIDTSSGSLVGRWDGSGLSAAGLPSALSSVSWSSSTSMSVCPIFYRIP